MFHSAFRTHTTQGVSLEPNQSHHTGVRSPSEYQTKCESDTTVGNMEIEDTTKYTVKTGSGGIVIDMKYESEREMEDSESKSEGTCFELVCLDPLFI